MPTDLSQWPLWQVQVRTLSKAYGLAGLRVGYAVAAESWISKADQIRIQFASSNLTGYLADKVLSHPTFGETLIADTIQLRSQFEQALAAGAQTEMTVLPSATNFVAIRYPTPADAAARQQALLKQGIAVHRPPHPAMQHLLRVTAGPQALDPFVLSALTCPSAAL
jgi:histidinol-phosphate aminotransferase